MQGVAIFEAIAASAIGGCQRQLAGMGGITVSHRLLEACYGMPPDQ
jgi:hypothetical protein